MPRWLSAKRVVIYGIAHTQRDHRDYAEFGEWSFTLYDRLIVPRIEAPITIRRTKKGRYSKRGRSRTVRVQYRDPTTGRFVKPPTFSPVPHVGIPDDDTIVSDVLRIVSEETGQRLYRTPSQQEHGKDRVSIGVQQIGPDEVKSTYTYDEFLKELRRRVENEWRNR